MAVKLKLEVVLPGDVVSISEDDHQSKKIRLGPGLRSDVILEESEQAEILASKCGILRHKPGSYWVDSNQKRVCSFMMRAFLYSHTQGCTNIE